MVDYLFVMSDDVFTEKMYEEKFDADAYVLDAYIIKNFPVCNASTLEEAIISYVKSASDFIEECVTESDMTRHDINLLAEIYSKTFMQLLLRRFRLRFEEQDCVNYEYHEDTKDFTEVHCTRHTTVIELY